MDQREATDPRPDGETARSATGEIPVGQQVKETARHQAQQLSHSVSRQATEVLEQARERTATVITEAQQRLTVEASMQTERLGEAIEALGDRLQALAEGRLEDAGPLREAADSIARQADDIATTVRQLELDRVVGRGQEFARRHPGTLALAAGLGLFAATRIRRNTPADEDDA